MQMMTNVGVLGVCTDYIIPGSLYSVLGSELQESNQNNEDNWNQIIWGIKNN